MNKKIVVFSGAGISVESGIPAFRTEDGMWNNYRIEDVASIDGWRRNRQLVLDFYNKRHRELETVEPNKAHKILANLEKDFEIQVITQNVDDLHERAGSTNVLHLHGELTKMRSFNSNEVYDWPYDINIETNSVAPDGSPLRPHIVWFGEDVPNMNKAYSIAETADIFVVIGTSLQVYPAANLIEYVSTDVPIYFINPEKNIDLWYDVIHIKDVATKGVDKLRKILMKKYQK